MKMTVSLSGIKTTADALRGELDRIIEDQQHGSERDELSHWSDSARDFLCLVASLVDPEEGKRPPTTHDLKIEPVHFHAIIEGRKTFEIRRDDRDFQVGDALRLRLTSGDFITVDVVYMSRYAMGPTGHVVLGIVRRCNVDLSMFSKSSPVES